MLRIKAFPGSGMMIHLPFVAYLNLMVYFAEVWYNKKKYGKCRFEKERAKDGEYFIRCKKIKVYEALQALCQAAGESADWGNTLWSGLLGDGALMEEMVYYLEHHCFSWYCLRGRLYTD